MISYCMYHTYIITLVVMFLPDFNAAHPKTGGSREMASVNRAPRNSYHFGKFSANFSAVGKTGTWFLKKHCFRSRARRFAKRCFTFTIKSSGS